MHARLLLAIPVVVASSLGAQARQPLLVSGDWLATRLDDPAVVVLHVERDTGTYAAGHIPGARRVAYDEIRAARDGNGTEIPDVEQMRALLEGLGVSDSSRVVIYAGGTGRAPAATRLFVALESIGHTRVSLLDGGLEKWRADGRAVITDVPTVTRGRLTARPRTLTVEAQWVRDRLGRKGVALLDTRTPAEYAGEAGAVPSGGHLPGARQLEWEQLFSDPRTGVFRDTAEIRALYAGRMSPGDTVVTYCTVGYRGSMTYFGARLLGLPVMLYDGSYEDWARRGLPLTKGSAP